MGGPVFEVCHRMASGSIAFVAVHSAGSTGGVTLSKPSAKTVICWALHDGNGGVAVGVAVAVAVGVNVGDPGDDGVGVGSAVGVLVAVFVGVAVGPDRAQYLPPVFK